MSRNLTVLNVASAFHILLILAIISEWSASHVFHRYCKNKKWDLSIRKIQQNSIFQISAKSNHEKLPIPTIENGVTLVSLDSHQATGKFLREAVVDWLNTEFIPLDIHKRIGDEVLQSYCSTRLSGESDLGQVMLNIGSALENIDLKDAFVNPWDIANKVSDLLIVCLNRETCSCTDDVSKYFKPASIDSIKDQKTFCEVFDSKLFSLTSEFDRYILLRDFLDGDIEITDMVLPFAITLGFRNINGSIQPNLEIAPKGWTDIDESSILGILDEANRNKISAKLEYDVRNDYASTGNENIVSEILIYWYGSNYIDVQNV